MVYFDMLDLERVTLNGWEKTRSIEVVDVLIKAIEMDQKLPPVKVLKITDGNFYDLSVSATTTRFDPDWHTIESSPDGGHHRAIAHYIVGLPLPVIVEEECKSWHSLLSYHGRYPISELELDVIPSYHEDRMKSYRPYARFCEELERLEKAKNL